LFRFFSEAVGILRTIEKKRLEELKKMLRGIVAPDKIKNCF
jgi:hypothetical protein